MTDKRELLHKVQELERESHRLWDESFTNIAFCNLTDESRKQYIEKSYEATRLHSEAMDILSNLLREIDELLSLKRGMDSLSQKDIQDVINELTIKKSTN